MPRNHKVKIGSPPNIAPGVPTGVTATSVFGAHSYLNGKALVHFTAADAFATSFRVTCSQSGVPVAFGAASPVVIENLTGGEEVTFTVQARHNVNGNSAESSPSTPFTAITAPGPPTIGVALGGNAQVQVAFTAPSDDGGSAITGYKIGLYHWPENEDRLIASGASSPITKTGLTNGTGYQFRVWAINAVGEGSDSALANIATATTSVPDAPTIGTATPDDASLFAVFTPAGTGGVASVFVGTATPGGASSVGTSPILISGLTNGTAYTAKVKARNLHGDSAESAASNSVTPTPNYALNQPATSNEVNSSGYEADKAVDGSASTRWASSTGGTVWLEVDLGTARAITEVVVVWQDAYATIYKIQSSDNGGVGGTWVDRATEAAGNGGTDNIAVATTARYWRVLMTASAIGVYSIYEFKVRG